jgi:ABC-2 type transport system permease protein
VKLNSMGASMADIRPEYITLWIQALIYFTISIWVYKKKLESNRIS